MESVKKGETLIPTPKWFIGLRVAQIVVALIIVALSGFLIHGYYADAQGIAIASGIFTWIIALYVILTEHSAACRSGYNTWAILSLDFFMIVLWLASLGANAAYRASFVVPVDADCYDDGSTVNAGHCVIYKREAVAGPTGRAVISAVAGISAINLLLFVATFAYVAHFFRLEWAKHSSDIEKASGVAAPTAQHQTLVNQQQPQWAQQQQQHQPPTYPTANAPYDPYTPSPYSPQSTGYAGAQGVYNQTVPHQVPHQVPHEVHNETVQYRPQELPSPQSTPAPGQPYYPPQ
ncbi:hypothetical protein F4801DRAFT_439452 [Xylaria longipes]|nr:hypothetical protein F4801DRAFT_439452 [Xylaria longipes]RYC62128.1 hypothetical protein CHU98_g4053 [Xylaria longipes]